MNLEEFNGMSTEEFFDMLATPEGRENVITTLRQKVESDPALYEMFGKGFIQFVNIVNKIGGKMQENQEEVLAFLAACKKISAMPEEEAKALLETALKGEVIPSNKELKQSPKSNGVLFQERLNELLFTNTLLENLLFGFSKDGRSIDWESGTKIENGSVTVSKKTAKKNAYVVWFDLDWSGIKYSTNRPLGNKERLVLIAICSEFAKYYSDYGYMPERIYTTPKRMARTLAGSHVRSEELEQILLEGAETLSTVRLKIDMRQHAEMKGKNIKKDIVTDYLMPVRSREQEKHNGENVTYLEVMMPPLLQYALEVDQFYIVPARMLQLPEVGNKKYTKERTFITEALIRNIKMPERNPRILLTTLATQSGLPYETKVQKQRFREKLVDILEDWTSDPEIPVASYTLEKKGRAFHAVVINHNLTAN